MNTKEFENFKNNCPYVQGLNEEEIYKEYNKIKRQDLIQKLANSDYEAIKYSEGWYTDEEYAPIKKKEKN